MSATWLAPRVAPFEGLDPAKAALWAINTSVRACGLLGRDRLRLALCAGPELGALMGEARDVPRGASSAELWAAAIAAPGLQWWVHRRVGLLVGAEVVVALRRPRFALRDDPTAAIVAGRGGLRANAGLALRLGEVARR